MTRRDVSVAEKQALSSTNNGVQGGMHVFSKWISEYRKVGQTPCMCRPSRADETQEKEKQLARSRPTASESKPQVDPPANQEMPALSESVFASMPYEFELVEAGAQQHMMAGFLGDVALMGADPNVGEQTRMVGPKCAPSTRADGYRKRRLEVAVGKVISWTSNRSQLRALRSWLHSDPETVYTVSHVSTVTVGAKISAQAFWALSSTVTENFS